ncbi:MAG: T9SS type A sorting domain-containing protein, partial [Flavobacteriaceae bacterium]|nr:T9SS type A sorting domain-containing protein [Flavobacteriaceae bacterium]
MKNFIFTLSLLFAFVINAQTTYQISWAVGSNGPETNLTIDVDDTVEWLWDDTLPHTVTSQAGSAEDFDSGTKTGINESFSFTFTVEGDNPYRCEIHPATMFGIITVDSTLGLDENVPEDFKLISNLSTDILTAKFPGDMTTGNIKIHNISGQQILEKDYRNQDAMSFHLGNFQDGIYIITIQSNNTKFAAKFIKQ